MNELCVRFVLKFEEVVNMKFPENSIGKKFSEVVWSRPIRTATKKCKAYQRDRQNFKRRLARDVSLKVRDVPGIYDSIRFVHDSTRYKSYVSGIIKPLKEDYNLLEYVICTKDYKYVSKRVAKNLKQYLVGPYVYFCNSGVVITNVLGNSVNTCHILDLRYMAIETEGETWINHHQFYDEDFEEIPEYDKNFKPCEYVSVINSLNNKYVALFENVPKSQIIDVHKYDVECANLSESELYSDGDDDSDEIYDIDNCIYYNNETFVPTVIRDDYDRWDTVDGDKKERYDDYYRDENGEWW